MPRKKIAISEKVEYLSILNEKGQLDKELEPDIGEDVLGKLHRTMLLARKFDERLLKPRSSVRLHIYAPVIGWFRLFAKQRRSYGAADPLKALSSITTDLAKGSISQKTAMICPYRFLWVLRLFMPSAWAGPLNTDKKMTWP